ncbi:branched chain amino acid aminotransferase [soil metagenome]
MSDHTTIAMWSGPRNISTAMMYSFGNRPDCFAWDEPFYAFSLETYGNDHPMREEIIAANDSDWERLVARCLSPPPAGKRVFYQKHMTHHMLEGFDRSWVDGVTNAFLIRSPEKVLASYARKWAEVDLKAIGFVEQAEIFDRAADRLGAPPPVIDAEDVIANPRDVLGRLCTACGIPFDEGMLAWPEGPKSFDGVWAPHWYETVWRSTGFGAPKSDDIILEPRLQRIADAARPYYERLRQMRLAV